MISGIVMSEKRVETDTSSTESVVSFSNFSLNIVAVAPTGAATDRISETANVLSILSSLKIKSAPKG